MNTVDLIIIICLLPFLVRGLLSGFMVQAGALIGWLIGLYLSSQFAGEFSSWMSGFLTVSPQILNIIAFVLIFIAAVLASNLIASCIAKLFKIVMLGWLDKLLGLVFSLLKGILVCCILVFIFQAINNGLGLVGEEILAESVLYGHIRNLGMDIIPYLKECIMNL